MAYTIISQNNTTTTLSDENGNVITVPARSILDAETTFTLVKINNSTATLEGSNGKIYRDIPCCIDLTRVTGFNVTKVNNNKATLEDTDGTTYAGVPCIVNLTESGGGSSAVIDPLNVTPSTSAQTITASGGVDGYSPVNVSAVDASIDANITAGNIKKDVSILGVTGTYEGQTPTGSISITSNGTYDVTDKAEAVVNVPTTAPAHYVEKIVDANGVLRNSTNIINLNGVTDVGSYILSQAYRGVSFPTNTVLNIPFTTISGSYACQSMFNGCAGLTSADMSALTTISGDYGCQSMFNGCTGLTNVDMSALTTISGYNACASMFRSCTRLTSADLSALTTINSGYGCSYMFNGCTGLTSVDLSSLTAIGGGAGNSCDYMFDGCTGLTSINLPALTTISGIYVCQNMFSGCTGLTSANLPALTMLNTNSACLAMFSGCTGLTSVDLSSLETISNSACVSMFYGCTGLTSVDLSSLTTITGGGANAMFRNCTSLKNIYLPKIQSSNYSTRPSIRDFYAFENSGLEVFDARNIRTVGDYGIFDNMLAGTSYLKTINLNSLEHIGKEAARALLFNGTNTSTLQNLYFPMLTSFGSNPFYTNCFSGRTNLTIHFRKDMQSTVQALANYATLWGAGTGSSAVFDLAGTLTGADSNSYARSEKDSVYASETAGAAKTATAWSYNDTIYYTSGGTEPSVGDTIYSDSACTTAVTTISSIA